MKRFLPLLVLLLAGSAPANAQEPAFLHEVSFDLLPRIELLNDDAAIIAGGHLQGIEFFQRAFRVDMEAESATTTWTYNEDELYSGFSTDIFELSDGNLMLFTPEDVSLFDTNIKCHLTKLDPDGNLLWTVEHLVTVQQVYFQARMRAFETADNRIVYFTPADQEVGEPLSFELRYYDLDGNFLEAAPIDIAVENNNLYEIGSELLTSTGTLLVAGRHAGNGFFMGTAPDGTVEFEHATNVQGSSNPWYGFIEERANGEFLLPGYIAGGGNLGFLQRFDANGDFQDEIIFGTAPDVVIARSVTEFSDGRVAVGMRWMAENEVWSPRVVVLDATLETELFSYVFPTEVVGVVEALTITSDDVLVGLNDMVLGSAERTDLWRMSLEPTIHVGEFSIDRMTIGPNPAVDRLQVFGPHDGTCRVYGLNGQLMLNGVLDASGLDITSLSPGVYLLEVNGSQGPVRIRWTKA